MFFCSLSSFKDVPLGRAPPDALYIFFNIETRAAARAPRSVRGKMLLSLPREKLRDDRRTTIRIRRETRSTPTLMNKLDPQLV
uniref:Uncharacterized protein n=1 Tax=Trichogramma kaykai TaxID=54128 RepID=A0ABD2W2P1_9HYME